MWAWLPILSIHLTWTTSYRYLLSMRTWNEPITKMPFYKLSSGGRYRLIQILKQLVYQQIRWANLSGPARISPMQKKLKSLKSSKKSRIQHAIRSSTSGRSSMAMKVSDIQKDWLHFAKNLWHLKSGLRTRLKKQWTIYASSLTEPQVTFQPEPNSFVASSMSTLATTGTPSSINK